MLNKKTLGLSMVGLLMTSAAFAQTIATAYTDLNLRSGPGPMYNIVNVIPMNDAVAVEGCTEGANWCKVTYGETQGWAAGNYLVTPVALSGGKPQMAVNTVTYTAETDEAAKVGLVSGVIAGALIAGPVGAVVGGILGGGAGTVVDEIDPKVVTYVQSNPVEPVYLDGEVVVGAGLPEVVALYPVPDSAYSYVYVNGVPVLVETPTRRIVRIVR